MVPRLLAGIKRQSSGFTLIELLMVVAIISLIASIIFASLSASRDKARIAAGKLFMGSVHHAIADRTFGVWSFESVGSLTALDSSGENNNGTLFGNAAQVAESVCDLELGGCLRLDGAGDYVIAPYDQSTIRDFTYMAWINPSSLSDEVVVALGGTNQMLFRVLNGAMELFLGGNVRAKSDPVVVANKWTHVAVTRKGSNIVIYVNGVSEIESTYPNTVNTSGCSLLIGADADSGCTGSLGNYFSGYVDEVKIYTTSLTAQEIGAVYTKGAPQDTQAAQPDVMALN